MKWARGMYRHFFLEESLIYQLTSIMSIDNTCTPFCSQEGNPLVFSFICWKFKFLLVFFANRYSYPFPMVNLSFPDDSATALRHVQFSHAKINSSPSFFVQNFDFHAGSGNSDTRSQVFYTFKVTNWIHNSGRKSTITVQKNKKTISFLDIAF